MSVQSKKREGWVATRAACLTAILDSDGEITLEQCAKLQKKSKQTLVNHLTNLETSWQELKDKNASPRVPVQPPPKVQEKKVQDPIQIREGDLKGLLWEKMKEASGPDLIKLTELYNEQLKQEECAITTYASWVQQNLEQIHERITKVQEDLEENTESFFECLSGEVTGLSRDVQKLGPIFHYEKAGIDSSREEGEEYTKDCLELIEEWLDQGYSYEQFEGIIQKWGISKDTIETWMDNKPLRKSRRDYRSALWEVALPELEAQFGDQYMLGQEFRDKGEEINAEVDRMYPEQKE